MSEIMFSLLNENASAPYKANFADSGFDITSCEEILVKPKTIEKVKTGLVLAIPEGFGGFVLPRSGLAINHGISIANSPGLIDSGYRGEIIVGLINNSDKEYNVVAGERIAQIVFLRTNEIELFIRNDKILVEETDRKVGGLGSTGKT
jgi:dUTP pyrophosphatase